MTTFAPNYTPRYRARYIAAGIEHTIQARAQRGQSAFITQGLGDKVHDCFDAFIGLLASDFAWISAEYALTDSDDFIPTSTPAAITGAVEASDYTLQQRCTSTNFNGRSVGSRAAFYMYGILWLDGVDTPRDNGRVTAVEDGRVSTVVGIAAPNFFSNGGTFALWHNYANIKVNDHLLKLLRRGTIS